MSICKVNVHRTQAQSYIDFRLFGMRPANLCCLFQKDKWNDWKFVAAHQNVPLIALQHKNTNIANFVLAVSFKIEETNKVCNLEM